MGLLKAAFGAGGGILADQWKEFFRCEALPANVLVTKGQKVVGGRSSNTKGTENIITNGSVILVADGQCMMIVDQGQIVEFASEPGQYTYDASTEPTIFCGNLGEGIKQSFQQFGKRFTFGGEPAKDQRIYYLNTKEIMGNKYGTPNPVPFRVVDQRAAIDIDINIRCFGEYSFRICDPVLFYKNVSGNVTMDYTRENIESQMKADLLTALGAAFAKISTMGIRYSALPGHGMELAEALNEVLTPKWRNKWGLEIVSFGVSSVKAMEEDEAMLKEMQRNVAFMDPTRAAAHMVGAQAAAMQTAAGNQGGAMTGFMGMGFAQQAGGVNTAQLFQMGQQPRQPAASSGWKCACGAVSSGKFCPECGAKKPADDSWICSCGAVNKGKFCPECGAKKPTGVVKYQCDKCGWKPADPTKTPRFCPECGDPFGAEDVVN